MRTTLGLDERLVEQALRETGARTKTDLVESGLRALLESAARERLAALRGGFPAARAPRGDRKFKGPFRSRTTAGHSVIV